MENPQIIGFLCNWCGYAGADLAGTSRIEYPTNIRIIRVMCSGRVNPAFILKAFELGADGVLVCACHPADCHYGFGISHAEKEMDKTRELLGLLGLGAERLRLEHISASEGEKFAILNRTFTEEIKKMGPNPLKADGKVETPSSEGESISEALWKYNVRDCLECGKCTSICPAAEVDEAYSPRRIIERFLLGFEEKILPKRDIWSCLTCYLCQERCPSEVRYPEFIRSCRSIAAREVAEELCAHEGIPLTLSRMMATKEINQNRLDWLPEDAKVSNRGDTLYFVGCLPYFDVIFNHLNLESVKIAQNTVRILNKVGIEPVMIKDERCCGHDLFWTGDFENFEKLARMNVEDIKKAQVTRVVTTCPECYRTLKLDYAELLGDLDFEVLHISELLSDLIEKGGLRFTTRLARKVVYHDSCRLGRHMGVYDPPRKVLTSIPGVELVEMERNREDAVCCGVSSWITCGKYSKENQINRLREAKNTGADSLISACPKCQIHWKCVMSEKLPINPEEIRMDIPDLTGLVAEAMNLL